MANNVVVVVDQAGIDRARRDPTAARLMDGQSANVLVFSKDPDGEIPKQLQQSGLWQPGTMAAPNPFSPGKWVSMDRAVSEFSIAHMLLVAEICAALGAKSIKVRHAQLHSAAVNIDAEASAEGGGTIQAVLMGKTKMGANLSAELTKVVNMICTLDSHYEGSSVNYPHAKELLDESPLRHNAILRHLLKSQQAENRMTQTRLTVEASEIASNNIRMAADLKLPQALGIHASIMAALKNNESVTLELEVKFL